MGKKTAIRGDGVIHRSGKRILGSETIIRSEDAEAAHSKKRGDGTMRLGRTGEIAAAMQIEKNVLRRIRRFDPFAGDAV